MDQLTDTLCLQCGLCCNGVLFADIRTEAGDVSPLFAQHGPRVAQPCPAFNAGDCSCAIYTQHPSRCRKFECGQLLKVRAGNISALAALKKIRTTRKLVAKVEKILGALGFNDATLPLKRRFDRCQRAAAAGKLPPAQFARLAELQLAMHRLNLLLTEDFYA
jgi:Fe-S-cluster containining protein